MVTDPITRIKHAFITGGTGNVGAPLARKLAQAGVQVTAYSRKPGDGDQAVGVTHVAGDILDSTDLSAATEGADVIFHVAAAVHGSASSYVEFERMNVTGTENVIAAAKSAGARLVHVSTVNVEGFQSGELTDAYAATKSQAEDLVLEAARGGLDAVIMRPGTVFGSEPGRGGMIVNRLLEGGLNVLPAPARKISPVCVEDLTTALVQAAESGVTGKIYTIAGPTISTGEFVAQVCEGAGVDAPKLSISGWIVAAPLQLAWWVRKVTRWTPPVSVQALKGSSHDGSSAARDLGFEYTPVAEVFASHDTDPTDD